MQRAGFIPLTAVLVLLAVTFQAQLVPTHGGASRGAGMGRGSGGQIAAGHLETHGRHHRRGRDGGFGGFRDGGFGGFIDPFWYDGYGYDEPTVIYESPERPPLPPPPAPEPPRIPTAPKMMEFPAAAKAQAPKPLPPAIFILGSGERIECRHYLLSADVVQLTVDRRQRSIPLEALDLNATVAANRQRGLELHIPSSGSEISLGF